MRRLRIDIFVLNMGIRQICFCLRFLVVALFKLISSFCWGVVFDDSNRMNINTLVFRKLVWFYGNT